MDERDWLARRFEDHRGPLRAVAYRMLGSTGEADDAVQEAWLRLSRSDAGAVDNLGGWLTTVVARVSLNMLQARSARRQDPVGGDLPEPAASRRDGDDPEQQALQAEGVGLALLVVLDTLTPAERLAFVLHDLFAVPFPGPGRATPRHRPGPPAGGGRRLPGRLPRGGLRRPGGPARPRGRGPGRPAARPALVDGAPGAVWAPGGRPRVAFGFTVTSGRIVRIDLLADPERLARSQLAELGD